MGDMKLLSSLIEQGATSEVEILISLHKTGTLNVVKWISETARNVLDGVLDETMSKKERLAKAEKLRSLVDVIIAVLKDEAEIETIAPSEEDEIEEVTPSGITVYTN